jgi:enoyl-CoA hydratase/carnithine racemase
VVEVSSDPVLTDRPGEGILRLRLDRPATRNAIDTPMVDALLDAVSDPGGSVVLLGSAHAGMFCSGADRDMGDAERATLSDRLYELYGRMLASPAVVLCAIDGAAVGGGAQLAVAADLRLASRQASLRFVGPGHGLAVGAWALPSLVGRGRALDLCLTMRTVAAEEALAIGLVDHFCEAPEAAALELATEIAALDADAVARVKSVAAIAAARAEALAAERDGNAGTWGGSLAGMRRG